MKNIIKRMLFGVMICFTAVQCSALCSVVDAGAASRAVTSYIWVGNVKLENGQYLKSGESTATANVQTDYYACYENGTLTLKNYTYSGEGAYNVDGYEYYDAVNCGGDLTIKLEGANSISLQENADGDFSYGITVVGNLEISAAANNASLEISGATDNAISVEGDVHIDGVSVALSNSKNGLLAQGDLTVTDGNLEIVSNDTGISCDSLTQENSTLDVTAGGIGIDASQDITVQSGKLVSRTTGTEENGNYVAIGSNVKNFNYNSTELQVTVSNSSSGMPTEQYTAGSISTYRYVLVVAKALTPKPSYYVSFDVNGLGVEPPKQSVVLGGKVTKPADPQVENYQFVAWYKDAKCTEVWDFDEDTISGTTTLYAKWTESSVVHVHDFGEEWYHDNTNHWTQCACGEKSNTSNHTFYNEGECIVCGFKAPTPEEGSKIWKILLIVGAAGGGLLLLGGLGLLILIRISNSQSNASATEDTQQTTEPDTFSAIGGEVKVEPSTELKTEPQVTVTEEKETTQTSAETTDTN